MGDGITMLGAPGSGKTTFLAALGIALLEREPDWRLIGEDRSSEEGLAYLGTLVGHKGEFPAATGDLQRYRWSLEGPAPRPRFSIWGRRRGSRVKMEFNFVDAPGLGATNRFPAWKDEGVRYLAGTSAILLLHDPLREHERGDAYSYAYGLLTAMRQSGDRSGSRLPHRVAVCITKFDDPRVLAAAERLGLVQRDQEPPGFPRVPDKHARTLFTELCHVSRSDTAALLGPLLEQTFHPDRIRYFVTSAIGFYVNPNAGLFDPGDYRNVTPGARDVRIRGQVHPVNVAEPVLWLGREISAGHAAEGRDGYAGKR